MVLRKLFIFAALFVAAGNLRAATLVYATGASGNVSAGSLQTLREALNNGASVKVLVTAPNDHVWAVPCTNTSVKLTSQAVVCVSNMGLGINIAMGAQFGSVSSPPQTVHFIINTSGQYVQNTVDIGTGQAYSHATFVYAMQWYVD
ncbi:hypothetical protein [Xanthomonas graminis]|uniref:hypothetical protein n=1 Tax=Xanthomonas graminis TaxID=3390026 RepID=UPI001187301E|nr:hypothetical protein [Xanthomonas translucens]UKE79343.1 hypothetical protein KM317_09170 [Xanthomonas translucens pv. arrhenatheri]